jgi:hypothetical protein
MPLHTDIERAPRRYLLGRRRLPGLPGRKATLLLALTGVSALLLSLLPGAPAANAQSASSLPPLPAGWPTDFQLGVSDSPGGAAAVRNNLGFRFRYQYLAGGVRTAGNWSTWNPDGHFATYYLQDSVNNGVTPAFTYYMMAQSAPGNAQGEVNGTYNNLQDRTR